MVGRREYFRQSSLWHCLSSISFTGASTSSSPVFDIAYPPFPLPSRTLPAVQSLTLPIQHILCRHEHFRQSSLWYCPSSISSADASTSGSPVFDIAYPASRWDPWQTSSEKKNPKNWFTADILDLCDKRRELRKKRFKPKGSETYNEMNNTIMRCMKRQKKIGSES